MVRFILAEHVFGWRIYFSLGQTYQIMSNKEVILSAGAIQSPQLLQLSGIGNSSQLAAQGINTLVNSPGKYRLHMGCFHSKLTSRFAEVGTNLQDHQMVPANFKVSSNDTSDALADPSVVAYWSNVYNTTGGGRFVDTFGNSAAFVRVSQNLTSQAVWQQHGDTAPGPNSPHIELVFANGWGNPNVKNPDNGYYLGLVSLVHTKSSN